MKIVTAAALGVLAFTGCPATTQPPDAGDPPIEAGPTLRYGFKLQNVESVDAVNEVTFELARELQLDYVVVPVLPADGPDGGIKPLNLAQIAGLAEKYNIAVLPGFYNSRDTDPSRYAAQVTSFLEQYKDQARVRYIEFQNEPNTNYDGRTSRHFTGTAAELARTNAEAYRAVKARWPEILVGSPGFIATTQEDPEAAMRNQYFTEYFDAGPEFDFLALHQYPKSSSYLQRTAGVGTYNFRSELDVLDTFRRLLADHGRAQAPIFVTEGTVSMPFLTDPNNPGSVVWDWLEDDQASVLLTERFLLTARAGSPLIGSFVSDIRGDTGSALFSYDANSGQVTKRQQFFSLKLLVAFARKYPRLSAHLSGEPDSTGVWVDELVSNDGRRAWVALCPFLFRTKSESAARPTAIATESQWQPGQQAIIPVGAATSVKVTIIQGQNIVEKTVEATNGTVTLQVEREPAYIELLE